MTLSIWKSFDRVENPPSRLPIEDRKSCFFAREYISGGGFRSSATNSLISNLKKPRTKEGTWEWGHKQSAVNQFARELSSLFGDDGNPFEIAAIPSSKRPDDPGYDPRMEMVFASLSDLCPLAKVICPLGISNSRDALHTTPTRLTPDEIYQNLKFLPSYSKIKSVVLIDDVITSGATFVACKRRILENCPEASIWGVFWARSVSLMSGLTLPTGTA